MAINGRLKHENFPFCLKKKQNVYKKKKDAGGFFLYFRRFRRGRDDIHMCFSKVASLVGMFKKNRLSLSRPAASRLC
jgi:hypothetical protein